MATERYHPGVVDQNVSRRHASIAAPFARRAGPRSSRLCSRVALLQACSIELRAAEYCCCSRRRTSGNGPGAGIGADAAHHAGAVLPRRVGRVGDDAHEYRCDDLYAAGYPGATVCDPALGAALSGGQPPTYTLPTTGFVSCPLIESTLTPRATWVTDELFPLTASGDITLTAQTSFIASSTGEGVRYQQATDGPFVAAPAIHISVAPTPPPAKAIVLHLSRPSQTHQLTVDAPPAARWSLYSIYDVICQDPPGATEEQ